MFELINDMPTYKLKRRGAKLPPEPKNGFEITFVIADDKCCHRKFKASEEIEVGVYPKRSTIYRRIGNAFEKIC